MSYSYRVVFWICDKDKCKRTNTRIIPSGVILIDDYCDYCGSHIHEPCLEFVMEIERHERSTDQTPGEDPRN